LILAVLGKITTDGGTYRALEFTGSAVRALGMYERMTLTNMAIEAGAMNGIIEADERTKAFLENISNKPYKTFQSDADAKYHSSYSFNVNSLEPQVAKPHSPDNTDTVRNVQGTKLTKCYIGSCTGGKISDFIAAAQILINQEVKVPTFVVPASTSTANLLQVETYKGITLKQILEKSGCVIAQSSCAACLGGPSDTVGRSVDRDVVISTTNRNFPGRMGSKKSEVYLASPYTVAASAVKGEITDPREFLA
jgi:3-isopropylmalate/(R)-2-methylmalate dehydratase large subunit